MIEFIPLKYYYEVYLYSAMAITLLTLLHTAVLDITSSKNLNYINIMGYIILILLIIYIGLRPVSGKYFVDMATYANMFRNYQSGLEIRLKSDVFFQQFIKFCASIMTIHNFFLLCAIMYIIPLFIFCKRVFNKFWFYGFFMFIISMQFWAFGTNGIRNGIAGSFFLLAISYYNRRVVFITLLVISISIHQSMLLPTMAYIMTLFYKESKTYLYVWLLAIPLSIAAGGVWENLFASLGFDDDRLQGYLTAEVDKAVFSRVGFRYDFLLYSAAPVFTGWYFIFKRKFSDVFYIQVFNIYLVANAFWILVIRANFSNRFAYLSWFMMGFVIIYPFVKEKFYKKPHFVIGKVLSAYFLFTYLMYIYNEIRK